MATTLEESHARWILLIGTEKMVISFIFLDQKSLDMTVNRLSAKGIKTHVIKLINLDDVILERIVERNNSGKEFKSHDPEMAAALQSHIKLVEAEYEHDVSELTPEQVAKNISQYIEEI